MTQVDSDQDSTTVSYSLEEDRIRDLIDDSMTEVVGEAPPQEDPPPRYEDIVNEHQNLPPQESMMEQEVGVHEEEEEEEEILIVSYLINYPLILITILMFSPWIINLHLVPRVEL